MLFNVPVSILVIPVFWFYVYATEFFFVNIFSKKIKTISLLSIDGLYIKSTTYNLQVLLSPHDPEPDTLRRF